MRWILSLGVFVSAVGGASRAHAEEPSTPPPDARAEWVPPPPAAPPPERERWWEDPPPPRFEDERPQWPLVLGGAGALAAGYGIGMFSYKRDSVTEAAVIPVAGSWIVAAEQADRDCNQPGLCDLSKGFGVFLYTVLGLVQAGGTVAMVAGFVVPRRVRVAPPISASLAPSADGIGVQVHAQF